MIYNRELGSRHNFSSFSSSLGQNKPIKGVSWLANFNTASKNTNCRSCHTVNSIGISPTHALCGPSTSRVSDWSIRSTNQERGRHAHHAIFDLFRLRSMIVC